MLLESVASDSLWRGFCLVSVVLVCFNIQASLKISSYDGINMRDKKGYLKGVNLWLGMIFGEGQPFNLDIQQCHHCKSERVSSDILGSMIWQYLLHC